nr:YbaK/EbsC family protein [Auraticoccus cholistanensis]
MSRPDLLAGPTARALAELDPQLSGLVEVAEIDPALADTEALCRAYDLPLAASANCVLVTGKRAGELRRAAVVVQASRRADINNVVRRHLDVRKISFTAHEEATASSGMEYGGITPIGLPAEWPLLMDAGVVAEPEVVIGSGLRRSKLFLPGRVLGELPATTVLELALAG